jgi:GINS complex subunit 1
LQVQHAKRTQALQNLPPYQTDTVRAVTREVHDLDREVSDILEPYAGTFDPSTNQATACALLVHHLCMRRNKRCLLAYHRVRAEKIVDMCWNGTVDADVSSMNNEEVGEGEGTNASGSGSSGAMSPEEDEYAQQYGDMLAAYK